MTLEQIKQAIAEGKQVRWGNDSYAVIKDRIGQYLIYRDANQWCIGLTWRDGVTFRFAEE